ncbi:MAG: DUF2059 domain-containing protein [Alphaproteobacteria bacterium]|nr:DUF2059 domain-containing protein [Alphaproteobacteria bacterium]
MTTFRSKAIRAILAIMFSTGMVVSAMAQDAATPAIGGVAVDPTSTPPMALAAPAPEIPLQSPEKMKLAHEYLSADPIEDQIKKAVDNVAEGIQPDQRILFKSMADKYIDFKKLRDSAERAAAVTFTEEELKAMTAFFNTPEGKSLRTKLPEYQKLVQPVITEVLQNFMLKIQDASVLQPTP